MLKHYVESRLVRIACDVNDLSVNKENKCKCNNLQFRNAVRGRNKDVIYTSI